MLVLALVGLAAPAVGQVIGDEPGMIPRGPVRIVDAGGGYTSRSTGMPVDCWTNANTTGLFRFLAEANGKHILDDFGFAPGPWSAQASRMIEAVDYAVWSNLNQPFRVRMKIWDLADIDFAGYATPGGSMINPAATPLRVEEFPPGGGVFQYFGEGFVQINSVLPGGPLSLPGSLTGIAVELETIDPITGLPGPTVPGATFMANNSARGEPTGLPANSVNPAAPGFSRPDYGRDTDNDGIFMGQPASSQSATERRHLIVADLPGEFVTYGYAFALRGNIEVSAAPTCDAVGLNTDGVWSVSPGAIGANGVKWYCFGLTSDANDANYKYVDLDTVGSSTNVAIAVYDSTGILIAFDDNSAGGTDGLLTFGIGRRANPNGGKPYDGWNWFPTVRGESPGSDGLLAGAYYVAVAAAGDGAVFGDGFFAAGNGPGGAVTFRLRTNVTGGANDPSDPPAARRIVGPSGEDPIVFPGAQGINAPLYSPDVVWEDVQLCRDADVDNPIMMVLFSAAATEPPGRAMYLFNDQGNLVASAIGGRPSLPTLTFGGSDPVLPAGRYYIASTFNYGGDDVDLAPDPTNNGRWHVRPRVNDGGYTMNTEIQVLWFDCPETCEPDFNQDGNVDQDDISCLAQVVAGDPSCSDQDPDFNGDGNVDQDDIDALSQVVAGAGCP